MKADILPPQNLESERGVLGSIILEAEVADGLIGIVRPEDFYRDNHQVYARHMFDMRAEGVPIDIITLEDRLRKAGQWDKAGGMDYLIDLANSVPHTVNARYYAQVVREKAIGRDLIAAAEAIRDAVYSGNHTADDLLGIAESELFAVRDARAEDGHGTMADAAGEALDRVRRRLDGAEPEGIETGLVDLDDRLGAWLPGQLNVVGARPGMGKTALGVQVALNCVRLHQRPALFVSLEMDRAEIGERYLSMDAGVDGDLIRKAGRLDRDDLARLDASAGRADDLATLWVDDSSRPTVGSIAAKARRLKSRHGLGLVVVDYLQLIAPESGSGRENRQEEIARISRSLKTMARELACPVLALAQLNRETEKREEKRPRMSDLRESGQIEQDAHRILLLHRPEYYDPNDRPAVAEVIVAKNRGGSTGIVEVAFRAPLTRFDSLYRGDNYQ